MNIFKPHRVLLILGNGFDLSLKLKTSYNDFMESDLFKSHVHVKHYPNAQRDEHDRNIFNYLTLRKGLRNWIDVEQELMRYATAQRVEYHKENGGRHSLPNVSDIEIRTSYQALCRALQDYIGSLDYSYLRKDASSLRLFQTIAASKKCDVISFNYTDLTKLVEFEPRCSISYIHGNIKDGIILGFQRFANMASGYDYMIKAENPNYKSCHLFVKMRKADEIIIFGHSLGITDHCYFNPFFVEQISEKAQPRRMTLFTLNQESKEKLVRQMVSLSNGKYSIFQDNTDVSIVKTENNDAVVDDYLKGLQKRMGINHLSSVFSRFRSNH